jgi:hypothetical protein
MKKVVTQEDLDQNPDLIDQGVQVGDEIEIPDGDVTANVAPGDDPGNEGGTGPGGTNPSKPPTKP